MSMRNKTTNVYTEWLPLIDGLDDKTAGIIFKNILKYQNGEDVKDNSPVWLFIKSKIDEYNNKRLQISEKRKENGKLGGLAKASKCYQMLPNDAKCSNKIKENKIKEIKIKKKPMVVSDDWQPTDETRKKLLERGIEDVDACVEYFKGQCQAKGIEYVNYDRAILNWRFNNLEFKKKNSNFTEDDFLRSIYEGRR